MPGAVGATSAQAYAQVAYASYVAWTHRTSPTIASIAPGMARPRPPLGGTANEAMSSAIPGTISHNGHAAPPTVTSTSRVTRSRPPPATSRMPNTMAGVFPASAARAGWSAEEAAPGVGWAGAYVAA